jgi:predicted phosphodiesterase
MSLLEYCTTDRQRQIIELYEKGLGYTAISKELGLATRWNARDTIRNMKAKAAMQGYSPSHDMTHTVPDVFKVRGVSTYYNDEGKPVGQWVKSMADKEAMLEAALEAFKDGFLQEIDGLYKPVQAPQEAKNEDRLSAYLIGDHHLNALCWSPETGGDDWDTNIAQEVLIKAVDKLVSAAGESEVGALINLGDFLHANSGDNKTAKGTPVDVDGRLGRTIRVVGNLFKVLITRMLETHKEVWLINVRGNHDPDASLWLNEMMRLYFHDESRVKVFDNFSKWIHFEWGKTLVVMHHGDRVKTQALYEAVTRDYAEQWGRTTHRYLYHGHIHHRTVTELGGLHLESFGVLCPPDAYHSASGYGSARSMSCVILDKKYGEHSRFKVGIDALGEE